MSSSKHLIKFSFANSKLSIKRYSIPIIECTSAKSSVYSKAIFKYSIALSCWSFLEYILAFWMYISSLVGSIAYNSFNNFSAISSLSSYTSISTWTSFNPVDFGCCSKPNFSAFLAKFILPVSI